MLFLEELKKIGLSDQEAEIYLILSTKESLKGSEVDRESKYSRQTVYTTLDSLIKLNLVEKIEKNKKVAKFKITHPTKLNDLLSKKEEEFEQTKHSISSVIENLTSDFNLISGQPGVQVFEGEEGVRKVLDDTLKNDKEAIYTYVDSTTIEQEIIDLDNIYVKNRLKKKIKKKILMVKTPEAEEYVKNGAQNEFTEIKLIDSKKTEHFYSMMQIYNNKIAYITYKNGNITSAIISDPTVYLMHKFIFEALWEKTT